MRRQQGGQQFSRRVGLARDSRALPLLKTVNNKPRKEIKPASQQTEEEITAPPEDTESELSEPGSPTTTQKGSPGVARDESSRPKGTPPQDTSKSIDDSDSDEEQAAWKSRTDISRRYFGTSKQGREQAKIFSASQESSSGHSRLGGSQEPQVQSRGSKRSETGLSSSDPPPKRGKFDTSRLDDDDRVLQRWGSQRIFTGKETNRAKQAAGMKSGAKKLTEPKPAKRKKEARPPTPKAVQPKFKSYDDDPFEQFTSKAPPKSLIKPEDPLSFSTPGSPAKVFLKHPSLSPGASPQQAAKVELKHPSSSLPEPLRSPSGPSARLRELDSNTERPFKDRNDPFSDISDVDMDENEQPDVKTSVKAKCPICNEAVDKVLLDTFSKGSRLSIRRQLQFCQLHKRKSAEDAWETRGYPVINWDGLSGRLTHHYKFIEAIIMGKASHYGDLLRDTVKEGKNRTLLKADGSLTPGYYGPRGLRALSENIVSHFSTILRERAVDDRLISSRGYSSYVEVVLVPELAVRLICEDMKVSPDAARSILEDSKWIGDLLHEDIGDTVDQVSDNEEA